MDSNHHALARPQSRINFRRSGARSLGLLASFALLAAACGSGDDSADAGVATLEDDSVATLTDSADAAVIPDEDAPETDPEEAALAFSQCMRDEGIDFPDLAIDAEGNINLREGFASVDRGDETFRSAMEACQGELAAGGFGGGRREALESPEVQDGLVAFSDCVRDEGYDVGDLTLGRAGGANGAGDNAAGQAANAEQAAAEAEEAEEADGEGQGPGEGRREAGFGDRTARFATQLGLDPEDPEVIEVMELCSPILDEALSAVGAAPGGRG